MRGRPKKTRVVQKSPKICEFSPRGRVGRPGYIELKHEEFEAIRLYDGLGLNQKEAAEFMKVSQQTFSRVLKNAHRCLAKALIKGEIIRIKGGVFKIEHKG